MKDYIIIVNLTNMLPAQYAFIDELFIVYYDKTIKKITSYIIFERYLNFITNKKFNIYNEQIQNFYIMI